MKKYHHDLWIPVNMYNFIYMHPEIMAEEEYFPPTRPFVEKYRKKSTSVPVLKHTGSILA